MDDIFEEVNVETNDETSPEDLLETLVGEGKKYADVNALAKSRVEADRFIEQLQRETAELREEVSKQMTMEEILTKIRESSKDGSNPQPRQPDNPPANPENEYSPEKIEELVRNTLQRSQKEQTSAQNEKVVAEKLKERFGAEAQLYINKKAKELGTTTEKLKEYARENPAMFFRLVQLEQTQTGGNPPAAPRPSSPPPSTSTGRDKAYYDKMKVQDRKAYFSPKVQQQMYKDMEATLKAGGTWS